MLRQLFDFDYLAPPAWRFAVGAKKQYGNNYQLNSKMYFRDEKGAVRLRRPNPLKGKAAIKAAKRATHTKGFYRKQREAIAND